MCRDCVESRAMKPKGCDSGLGKVHCVHILSLPALSSRWSAPATAMSKLILLNLVHAIQVTRFFQVDTFIGDKKYW